MDKNKLKKIGQVIFWLAIVALIIYFVFIRKTKEEVKNEESTKQEQIIETKNKEITGALITKYNALEYKEEEYFYITTLSLQNKMINSRPVAFTGVEVNDVFTRDNKYYMSFSPDLFSNLVIELECSKEVAENVNNMIVSSSHDGSSIENKFAIIATIFNVSKPQLVASLSEGEYGSSIEIDSNSDILLLKGKSIDIVNY